MGIGHGFEEGVHQGPLINIRGKEKVVDMVGGSVDYPFFFVSC